MIPALVFILLLETIWSGNIRSLLGRWKPLLVIAVASIVMILTELFVVAIKYKVSPTRLMKKLLPYGMSCSIEWLLIAWLTSTLLSIATPPVSGGSMACFAVLLSQMSVPAGTIAYALAMIHITHKKRRV